MSLSKEERERITRLVGTVDGQAARLLEFPEDHDTESRELASDAEALVSDARTLLSALGGVDERIAELQRENQQLRDTLTSTDAERRFWENEVAMIQDSVVNGEEEEDV